MKVNDLINHLNGLPKEALLKFTYSLHFGAPVTEHVFLKLDSWEGCFHIEMGDIECGSAINGSFTVGYLLKFLITHGDAYSYQDPIHLSGLWNGSTYVQFPFENISTELALISAVYEFELA